VQEHCYIQRVPASRIEPTDLQNGSVESP